MSADRRVEDDGDEDDNSPSGELEMLASDSHSPDAEDLADRAGTFRAGNDVKGGGEKEAASVAAAAMDTTVRFFIAVGAENDVPPLARRVNETKYKSLSLKEEA